jgi:hypothetical protein
MKEEAFFFLLPLFNKPGLQPDGLPPPSRGKALPRGSILGTLHALLTQPLSAG